jgi:hypothetical protein
MNENDFFAQDSDAEILAAEAIDETFFHLMDGLFSRGFSALADDMLAENDDVLHGKRASMHRHPSGRLRS